MEMKRKHQDDFLGNKKASKMISTEIFRTSTEPSDVEECQPFDEPHARVYLPKTLAEAATAVWNS
jgi:hypothetical protein